MSAHPTLNSALLVVLCLCCLATKSYSSTDLHPNDYFSEQDAKSMETLILSLFNAQKGSFNDNLKDTYYAVSTLKKLEVDIHHTENICKYVQQAIEMNKMKSVFYSVGTAEALGCGTEATSRLAMELETALEEENLYDLVYAVQSVSVLKANHHIDDDSLHDQLVSAATTILGLLDEQYGTWFLEKNQDEEGSPYFTGLALSALSRLIPYLEDTAELNSVIDSIPSLLENTEDDSDESRLFFRHTDGSISSLVTTSFLIQGLADFALASEEDIGVSDNNVELITSFLINQKHVSSIEDAYSVVFGLNAVDSGGAFKRPVVLTLSNTQVHATKEKDRDTGIKVKVTDIWGNAVEGPTRVYLVRAFQSGKEEMALLSNQEIQPVKDEKSVYSFDFLAARPDPGSYVLEFRVIPQEKDQNPFMSLSSVQRRVQVVAAVGLSDGSLSVLDSSDRNSRGDAISFEQQKQIPSLLQLKSQQYLLISFKLRNTVSGRGVSVHQTFLKVTNHQTKQTAYFVIPQEGQTYTLQLGVAKLGKLGYVDGTYDLELLIGDSFVSSSLRWVLVKANIDFDSKSAQSSEEVVDPFAPLPIIEHKFRPAATRAPEYITNIFSVLVVIPLPLLMIGILRFGGNLKSFPTSGLLPLYGLLFVLGIGSMLCLIVVYWFSLKLFSALFYGGVLAVPTIFFGHRLLHSFALTHHTTTKIKTN